MGSRNAVHTIRFFELDPRPINCLCYDPSTELLALARPSEKDEAWIEIWSRKGGTPVFQRWIPIGESSIEGLAFGSEGRLYSTGLHGYLLVHDVWSLETKPISVSWGAAWCIDYHSETKRIAIGTEEGVVCIFQEDENGGVVVDKTLDKQEGRILCLAWEPTTGNKLVTGSSDTLRIWDYISGHPLHRLSTGRTEQHRETTVWSVAFLSDNIIISGDSRGKTSFWNAKTGTLLESYQTHKADILSVKVNREETVAYSTGVDPIIMHFQPIERKNGTKKWVKSIHRWANAHDNRSILHIEGQEVALAGVDSALTVTANKYICSYPPLPCGDVVSLSREARLMLFRYNNALELWKLGSTGADPKTSEEFILPLKAEPTKLLRVLTKDKKSIWSSDISSCGRYLAYAMKDSCRFYSLELSDSEEPPVLKRIKPSEQFSSIRHIKFYSLNNIQKCLLATNTGDIIVINLFEEEGQIHMRKESDIFSQKLETVGCISALAIQGNIAVLADFHNNAVAVDLEAGKKISSLPKYDLATLTSIAINYHRTLVLLAYSNGHVVECSLKSGAYTNFFQNYFSRSFKDSISFSNRKLSIRGVSFDAKNDDKIIVYDSSTIFVLDKIELQNNSNRCKKAKTDGTSEPFLEKKTDDSLKIITKYEHLLYFSRLNEEEFIAVEVKQSAIDKKLAPCFKQKKFGTK